MHAGQALHAEFGFNAMRRGRAFGARGGMRGDESGDYRVVFGRQNGAGYIQKRRAVGEQFPGARQQLRLLLGEARDVGGAAAVLDVGVAADDAAAAARRIHNRQVKTPPARPAGARVFAQIGGDHFGGKPEAREVLLHRADALRQIHRGNAQLRLRLQQQTSFAAGRGAAVQHAPAGAQLGRRGRRDQLRRLVLHRSEARGEARNFFGRQRRVQRHPDRAVGGRRGADSGAREHAEIFVAPGFQAVDAQGQRRLAIARRKNVAALFRPVHADFMVQPVRKRGARGRAEAALQTLARAQKVPQHRVDQPAGPVKARALDRFHAFAERGVVGDAHVFNLVAGVDQQKMHGAVAAFQRRFHQLREHRVKAVVVAAAAGRHFAQPGAPPGRLRSKRGLQ